MRQYRRNEADTTVGFFDAVMAASDRSEAASLLCLLQCRNQGKLIITLALEENSPAITGNAHKTDA